MKLISLSDIILFENENLVVVNKPAMLPTLEERTQTGKSLQQLAKAWNAEAQICHRLDKETSGCIIIAKNPETYRFVSMQFEHREVDKTYHAIVDGLFDFKELQINLPILNQGQGKVKIDRQEGKKAETIFNSIQFFKHYTLVSCKPITGRMHQLRIHLASQHAAIVGDEMYKGKAVFLSELKRKFKLGKDQEEQPIMKRFALHAYQITFNVAENSPVTIIAPYPKDFATLLKLLEKFD